jgi:ABC-type lipoprotein release transport system permease subunit
VALVLALGLGAGAVIFGAEPALAAYLPARRAARLHRMEVLRQE